MISSIFATIFYNPLYNGLIYLIGHLPNGDIGIAVILFTCIVKFILFPLSKSSVVTQLKMKALEPELQKIKDKNKGNKEEEARQTLEFYRANKLNPFAGVLLMLIQLPIIIALAFIFYRGGLPTVHLDILYSFIKVPAVISMYFFGTVNIAVNSIVLSVIAGVSQFFQVQYSVPKYKKPEGQTEPNFKDDLARSMNTQMRYVLPAMVFFFSLGISGAVALYWITSNLFTIAQEVYFRQTIKKVKAV